jgi:hypothetical protein
MSTGFVQSTRLQIPLSEIAADPARVQNGARRVQAAKAILQQRQPLLMLPELTQRPAADLLRKGKPLRQTMLTRDLNGLSPKPLSGARIAPEVVSIARRNKRPGQRVRVVERTGAAQTFFGNLGSLFRKPEQAVNRPTVEAADDLRLLAIDLELGLGSAVGQRGPRSSSSSASLCSPAMNNVYPKARQAIARRTTSSSLVARERLVARIGDLAAGPG